MGVLNITPDSFSDGGQFTSEISAVNHALALISDGADIIDLGAESSRPGSEFISVDEEWKRLEPVLRGIRALKNDFPISIDTRKPEIMKRATAYDINYINNIEGLTSIEDLQFLAKFKDLSYIAMHMYKNPQTMQTEPLNGSLAVSDVSRFFEIAWTKLIQAGFEKERIWLDPGIGFGKDDSANLKLLHQTHVFSKTYNLAIGVSRKSWIGRTLEISEPIQRDQPSKMIEISQAMAGAKMIRTHDVKNLAKLRQLWLKDE